MDFCNGINDIKYLFNENEDYYEDKVTQKKSPIKSINEDIKRDTYYAEKIKKNKNKNNAQRITI